MVKRRSRPAGYQITTHIAVALLLLILFVTSAYLFVESGSSKATTKAQLLQEIETKRSEWNERRPLYYDYVVDRDCECSIEVRTPYNVSVQFTPLAWFAVDIETEDGEVLSQPRSPVWLPQLFGIAAEAVEADQQVTLRYSRRFAFISSLQIIRDDGSEIRYEIRDFEATEYQGSP